MLDLSEEPLEENLEICQRYLERMTTIDMTLEIELGVTGGEEDGVDNSGVDNSKLYTQPEDVAYAYDALKEVGAGSRSPPRSATRTACTSRATSSSRRAILQNSQEYIQKERHRPEAGRLRVPRRLGLVAREDQRSRLLRRREDEHRHRHAVGLHGIKKYMDDKHAYLQGQLGNPEGPDKPNKKHIDPRVWLRAGEASFVERLKQAFAELNNVGTLG